MPDMISEKKWMEIANEADLKDIEIGNVITIDVTLDNGVNKSILLIKTGIHEWNALDNLCTHDGGNLDDGYIDLEKNSIECCRHGAHFNFRTGEVLSMPAIHPIGIYNLKIESEILYINI